MRRILVAGPAWVGDMVMAQALYRTLRKQDPDCCIEVVAPPWSLPLIGRMPEVAAAHALEVGHGSLGLGTRWRLGRSLRSRHFDQAIILPRSLKAALVPFFAGARQRTGYLGEHRYGLLNDIRPLDKKVLTRTVERFVALGLSPDADLPPSVPEPQLRLDEAAQAAALERLGLTSGAITFAPGAEYGPAKQWPPTYWRELAQGLVAGGHCVWILGSAKERELGEGIAQGIAGVHNLCGETSLIEAVDLLAASGAVVSNDSGLMHVAAAVGAPLIAIYGSSTPDYTPPLTAKAQVLYRRLDCSPCFRRECPLGHTDCLRGISADFVREALVGLLANHQRPEVQ